MTARLLAWLAPGVSSPAGGSAEKALAYGRALLALWSGVAVFVDPTEPSRFVPLAYALLVAYAAASLAFTVFIRRNPEPRPSIGLAAHGVDVGFAAVISLLTDGPNSPFFVFFVYVLLSAAFRWGYRATVATAAAGIVLILGQAAFVGLVAPDGRPLELNRVLMRVAHLAVMGALVGRLGEGQRRATVESTAGARIVVGIRRSGVRRAMEAAAREIIGLFDARAVLVAWRAHGGGLVRTWSRGSTASAAPTAFGREEEREYLAVMPGGAGLFDRRRDGAVPGLGGRPWDVALAADFMLGEESSGRVFVLDPGPAFRGLESLRFLRRLVSEVAPAVENAYLLSRLRSRAGAVERGRVARELHDGVLQALIGLEMQVDVLRRRAASTGEGGGAHPLTHIQAHLRHEIITVRELMEQMRPVDVAPRDLVEHLAAIVDRFRHETGLAASFVCDVPDVDLPGRVCRELVRVVQEALVNVRRHSGASNVMVRLGVRDGDWTLVVDDDGKGLSFEGRLDDRQLAARRLGPVVIRERVAALGGRLAVDSGSGRGTRLEVVVPQVARG